MYEAIMFIIFYYVMFWYCSLGAIPIIARVKNQVELGLGLEHTKVLRERVSRPFLLFPSLYENRSDPIQNACV